MTIRRKALTAVAVVGAALLALAFVPGRAAAATQSVSPTLTGSGSQTSILSALAVCDECAPDAFFTDPTGFLQTWGFGVDANIQAQADWSGPAQVDMSYTAGNLRHGSTLDLTDTLTPQAGNVTVNYSVTGRLGLYGSPQTGSLTCYTLTVTPSTCNGWVPTTDTLTVGPITGSDSIPCTLPLPGESPRDCSNTKSITLWNTDIFDFVSIEVDLILEETVHVTSSGVTSVRIAVINGGPAIANRTLSFVGTSPSSVSDPISIPCSAPVGNDLMYSLTSIGSNVEPATYTGDLKFKVSASAFGFGGSYTTPAIVGTSGADLGPIALSAPNQQVDLGPVLAANTPPTLDVGGPYSGNEGSPITFDGSGSTSACGLAGLTLVWHFSDGGVAYGVSPQHTFLSPGTFSGLLTGTDIDGNTASMAFSIDVPNVAPTANAGPDMSSRWGIAVALNGSAYDPGTLEQPFLSYSWDFGDGTPSASGGAAVSHVYAAPGTYNATLTACDPEGACTSDSAQVVVSQRATTLSYTGPNQSNPSKDVTFTATLVDEYGQPVAGRWVDFTLGSQSISAKTSSAGVASATIKLSQKKGTYTLHAAFAGDTKYVASSDDAVFVIGQ